MSSTPGAGFADGERPLAVIYFKPDQAVLWDEYRPTLDLAGEYLWRNPGASLVIRGYTAPAGTDANRMTLAEERAKYCRDYIVRRYEVAESRIRMEWFGARRLPLSAREGNWSARRAAELVIEFFMED